MLGVRVRVRGEKASKCGERWINKRRKSGGPADAGHVDEEGGRERDARRVSVSIESETRARFVT